MAKVYAAVSAARQPPQDTVFSARRVASPATTRASSNRRHTNSERKRP
jgi:hypothetical protein